MSKNTRSVGILGGGQLSLMLAEAARHLGLHVRVFAQSNEEPAIGAANDFVLGSLSDSEKLKNFGKNLEVIAFESDFIPFQQLRATHLPFCPALNEIERLGCKWEQRTAVAALTVDLPQVRRVEFQDLTSKSENEIDFVLSSSFTGGAVLKWKRGGYDGKGVLLPGRSKGNFIQEAQKRSAGLFAESFIEFQTELALTAVRNTAGEIFFYPLVISSQKEGICHLVKGPAASLGVSAEIETIAREVVKRIGTHFSLIGAFAVEFFLDHDNRLIINEIAPRVHNTSHYTQDACVQSQFENHWRALLNLGEIRTELKAPFFGMRNLLGRRSVSQKEFQSPSIAQDLKIHWYGKSESRPGRKMGHINLLAGSAAELEKKLQQAALVDTGLDSFL